VTNVSMKVGFLLVAGISQLTTEGVVMIILGIILLVLGLLVHTLHILFTIGIIVLVVGVILAVLGATGHGIAGRRHYF
jgi:membrane-bound ClpP family serine protease